MEPHRFSPNSMEPAMPTEITNDLPPAISRLLAACNGHDIDAWMATFDPDALVNDVQREFAGAEAIRAFAAKEIFGDRVTFTPLAGRRSPRRHHRPRMHRRDLRQNRPARPADSEPLLQSPGRADHPVDHHPQ